MPKQLLNPPRTNCPITLLSVICGPCSKDLFVVFLDKSKLVVRQLCPKQRFALQHKSLISSKMIVNYLPIGKIFSCWKKWQTRNCNFKVTKGKTLSTMRKGVIVFRPLKPTLLSISGKKHSNVGNQLGKKRQFQQLLAVSKHFSDT